jgi:hypothetical protein
VGKLALHNRKIADFLFWKAKPGFYAGLEVLSSCDALVYTGLPLDEVPVRVICTRCLNGAHFLSSQFGYLFVVCLWPKQGQNKSADEHDEDNQ